MISLRKLLQKKNLFGIILSFEQLGEVPKLAEGTPLERVQVVNSGARVQIPPSPLRAYSSAG